jgi:EAL domain-containing protein (putative c-di-GMP-specific phosphodiesterase class I)
LFASVNLSRRQLKDSGLLPSLKSILEGGGIAQGTLNLEVTESTIASDGSVTEIMARIRALGAGLSIDDFGIGASTLSELRNLPVDTVKIDKSFLSRKEGEGRSGIGSDGETMLSGIVSLAHELKRMVVAEGVESEADAQMLARLGCDFGQGYYFSPPLDGAAALDYIARHYNITATPQFS